MPGPGLGPRRLARPVRKLAPIQVRCHLTLKGKPTPSEKGTWSPNWTITTGVHSVPLHLNWPIQQETKHFKGYQHRKLWLHLLCSDVCSFCDNFISITLFTVWGTWQSNGKQGKKSPWFQGCSVQLPAAVRAGCGGGGGENKPSLRKPEKGKVQQGLTGVEMILPLLTEIFNSSGIKSNLRETY